MEEQVKEEYEEENKQKQRILQNKTLAKV